SSCTRRASSSRANSLVGGWSRASLLVVDQPPIARNRKKRAARIHSGATRPDSIGEVRLAGLLRARRGGLLHGPLRRGLGSALRPHALLYPPPLPLAPPVLFDRSCVRI